MKNWVIQGFLYDISPSPHNYIKFKWYHFYFCKKDDPSITASLYLDNLADELKHEIATQTSVNKKSLTLAVIKKILENKETKQELTVFFERKQAGIINEEIKQLLNQVSFLLNSSPTIRKQITEIEEPPTITDFPVRTYAIATHIYLEINNNEFTMKRLYETPLH
jgi:hypothetical protein